MVERAREQGFYLGLQTATDAHALAINDLYHIGPGRYPDLHAKAGEYINEIAKLIRDDTKDLNIPKPLLTGGWWRLLGKNTFSLMMNATIMGCDTWNLKNCGTVSGSVPARWSKSAGRCVRG